MVSVAQPIVRPIVLGTARSINNPYGGVPVVEGALLQVDHLIDTVASRGVSTTPADTWETGDITVAQDCDLLVKFYVPISSATTSSTSYWGGLYSDIFVSYDSGNNWVDLGRTGFAASMWNGNYHSSEGFWTFPIEGVSAGTVRFKLSQFTHTLNGTINSAGYNYYGHPGLGANCYQQFMVEQYATSGKSILTNLTSEFIEQSYTHTFGSSPYITFSNITKQANSSMVCQLNIPVYTEVYNNVAAQYLGLEYSVDGGNNWIEYGRTTSYAGRNLGYYAARSLLMKVDNIPETEFQVRVQSVSRSYLTENVSINECNEPIGSPFHANITAMEIV